MKQTEHILVGFDFSPCSSLALQYGIDFSVATGAELGRTVSSAMCPVLTFRNQAPEAKSESRFRQSAKDLEEVS